MKLINGAARVNDHAIKVLELRLPIGQIIVGKYLDSYNSVDVLSKIERFS